MTSLRIFVLSCLTVAWMAGGTLDLEDDGVVGISDILAVLSRFGDTC